MMYILQNSMSVGSGWKWNNANATSSATL